MKKKKFCFILCDLMSAKVLLDLSTIPFSSYLSPSGGGVSGGGGGRGSGVVLDSFQAAIIYTDRVSMQAAETGESI